jgi:hypothetical protein
MCLIGNEARIPQFLSVSYLNPCREDRSQSIPGGIGHNYTKDKQARL